MNLKMSQGKTIQMNSHDQNLAKQGIKTCTSRYGDRTAEYKIGEIYDLKDNDTDEVLQVEIVNMELKKLKDVTSEDALAIGNYSWADHVADFYGIYHTKLGREANENTILTLIWFKKVN